MDTVERLRRYARLVSLSRNPDEPMLAFLWWSSGRFLTYLYATRLLKRDEK